MKNYCILGTDNRSVKLKELYIKEGNKISNHIDGDYIIAPIPFSRDDEKVNGETLTLNEILNLPNIQDKVIFSGAISNNIKTKLKQNNVTYYDLMELDEVAILNSIPTAEGAIGVAMEMTDFTLCESNVLVMGFGRIGKILSKMLHGIGANVCVEARKEKDLSMVRAMGYTSVNLNDLDKYLNKFDIIFNTVPTIILDKDKLNIVNRNCSIIDLASSPGGIDFIYAKEIGLNVVWALALPGKVAPLSSAIYVKEAIDKIIKK
ncbi:MAG: dipicolinate synthase subunit DpsA [Clostridia bacterium]|nr:dipicolinate synthase subunit DpsA [Clostridia bacterium]MDD4386787.1 dipicolinate synthase subunit DpsA [Clostridia bacterium]